jgi:FMN reductase
MNVLSICGSLRPASTTGRALDIARAAAAEAGATASSASLDSLGLPFCDGRADERSYGPSVRAWQDTVGAADLLLIGSPEYHGSMTGALKNALDLLGPDALRGKMVGLLATARGDAGAMNTLNHLRHVSRWMNAWVLPHQVSIPRAGDAFGADGPSRGGLRGDLEQLGRELVRFGGLLR